MAQVTHVRKRVFAPARIAWIAGPFEVHHDIFPTISVGRHYWNRFGPLRHLSKAYAGQATLNPLADVLPHRRPPCYSLNQHAGLVVVTMASQYSCVALAENLSLSGQVSASLAMRYYWYPRFAGWRGQLDLALQDSVWRHSVPCRWSFVPEHAEHRFVRSLSGNPGKP